jgi:hypothetical protein
MRTDRRKLAVDQEHCAHEAGGGLGARELVVVEPN